MEFSENCVAISQDQIQSAHRNHNQITIFTACAWRYELLITPWQVPSLRFCLKKLRNEVEGIHAIEIFFDDTASQFENRFRCIVKSIMFYASVWGHDGFLPLFVSKELRMESGSGQKICVDKAAEVHITYAKCFITAANVQKC